MTVLAVLVAGAIGAVLRDDILRALHRAGLRSTLAPVAIVNVTGAFLLGLLLALDVDEHVRAVAGAGLLGAYTTYSTWMVESVLVGRRRGFTNIAVQTVLGLLAVLAAGLLVTAAR